MRNVMHRLGILPYLLLAVATITLGAAGLDYLTTVVWLFDVERLDLVRAVSRGLAESAALIDAAYVEVLGFFLMSILLIGFGLGMPISYLFNRRLARQAPNPFIVIRQAAWVGFIIAFSFWLQMNRTLSIPVLVLVMVVFVLFEVLLQVRGRAADQTISYGRASRSSPKSDETSTADSKPHPSTK